jgi:hypothetical protein
MSRRILLLLYCCCCCRSAVAAVVAVSPCLLLQAEMRSVVLPMVLLNADWDQYYAVVYKGSQEFAFLLAAHNMGEISLGVDHLSGELGLPERFFPGALSQQVSHRLLQAAVFRASQELSRADRSRCCWGM